LYNAVLVDGWRIGRTVGLIHQMGCGILVIQEAEWTASDYEAGIRRGVYGLWSGKLDASEAYITITVTIQNGLTAAWYQGAAACGITPEELSIEEMTALSNAIFGEMQYLERLIYDVAANNKQSGYKLKDWNPRISLWANRFGDVKNRAQMMACGDKKLKWILGPTEDHCFTCLQLSGKVKRASTWAASGWTPQGKNLDCGGWNCKCELVVTDEEMTPGSLPRAV